MIRLSLDDGPQADQRLVSTLLSHDAGCERNFEAPRHVDDVNGVILASGAFEDIQRTVKQLAGHHFIEAADHNRDSK